MDIWETAPEIRPGDLILLIGSDRKEFIFRVQPGQEMQTHRGVLAHDAIIGQPWGQTVLTHLEYEYQVYPPSLEQLVRNIRRSTQIIYPKDVGYILMKMNIGPGVRIVEAGTGSGGLTLALARMVQPGGHVYTYDARADIQKLAEKNLARLGLAAGVTFTVRDIAEGFDQRGVDALFLDVREPWRYLLQVRATLKSGGFFGSILPTANQVAALIRNLRRYNFDFVEVDELLLRPYKTLADRLRPEDRMVAHTGYLVFARPMLTAPNIDEVPEISSESPEIF